MKVEDFVDPYLGQTWQSSGRTGAVIGQAHFGYFRLSGPRHAGTVD